MIHPLVDYFRCPEHLAVLETADLLPPEAGYFRVGETIAYGRQAVGPPSPSPNGSLVDVSCGVSSAGGRVILPFDLSEVVGNLRHERYPEAQQAIERVSSGSLAHAVYYFLRPLLPVGVRRHLQALSLAGWDSLPFPRWPVDVSVEAVMNEAAAVLLRHSSGGALPFVWFWPDGAPACVMMSHDVEGPAGASLCDQLMDLDDRFSVPSSFQVIPEGPRSPAAATERLAALIRERGFELNIHDFNHDGSLFRDNERFLRLVPKISEHARRFGSRGFRAGALYRRQEWLPALEFSYDMTVPSVAHLEPQRGGCCTVMPFFIGNVLELPLTTIQDYSLFHVLHDYSISLWQAQVDLIVRHYGLVSFNTHPDYLIEQRARDVYAALLGHLAELRRQRQVWIAPPAQIDTWWRNRSQMRLVPDGPSWRIEGPGCERARIAYAKLDGGRVVYEVGAA